MYAKTFLINFKKGIVFNIYKVKEIEIGWKIVWIQEFKHGIVQGKEK